MNVNAHSDALIKLHRTYLTCVEEAMKKFLDPEQKSEQP